VLNEKTTHVKNVKRRKYSSSEDENDNSPPEMHSQPNLSPQTLLPIEAILEKFKQRGNAKKKILCQFDKPTKLSLKMSACDDKVYVISINKDAHPDVKKNFLAGDIIEAINGYFVNSVDDFQQVLAMFEEGAELIFGILRLEPETQNEKLEENTYNQEHESQSPRFSPLVNNEEEFEQRERKLSYSDDEKKQLSYSSQLTGETQQSQPISEDELPKDGRWMCSACTFYNHEQRATCEVCAAVKPLSPKKNDDGLWTCSACTFINEAARDACKICDTVKSAEEVITATKFCF